MIELIHKYCYKCTKLEIAKTLRTSKESIDYVDKCSNDILVVFCIVCVFILMDGECSVVNCRNTVTLIL